MTLENVIRDTPQLSTAWDAKDDAAVLAGLNAAYTVADKTPWTLAALGARAGELLGNSEMGVYARRLLADTMQGAIETKAPGYGELIMAGHALAGSGLTLYEPDRQEVVRVLGVKWPPEILAAVLACGQRPTTLAKETIGRDATQEDLDEIRNAAERARRQGFVQEVMSSVCDQITHETTRAEIMSMIDTALTGRVQE